MNAPREPTGIPSPTVRLAPVLIALAYVALGKLSLLLALPEGYATPVFPAAGLAIMAAYFLGPRALPGIFAGAAVVNFAPTLSLDLPASGAAWAMAAVAGTSSMLQAAAGGWALRRALGLHASLDRPREIARAYLLLPLVCLVSASLAVPGLVALGLVDASGFGSQWFAWWTGDTFGAVLALPVAFVIAGRPREAWRGRARTVALPMALALALFSSVFLFVSARETEDWLRDFRLHSDQLATNLQSRLAEQEFVVRETEAFLTHNPERTISREEFRRYATRILDDFPMVQAVEWAPQVPMWDRTAFEARQARDVPGFEIREPDGAGGLRRAGARAEYYPVTLVEPLAANAPALGLDLGSTPPRRRAVEMALGSRQVVATAPIHLVQEHGGQQGVLAMMRVGNGPQSPGVVLIVLRMGDFVRKAQAREAAPLVLRLVDTEDGIPLVDGPAESAKGPVFHRTLDFGGRHYRLETEPAPAYREVRQTWRSVTVIAFGVVGTALLGAFLLLGTGYTARVERSVREATGALRREVEKNRLFLRSASDGVHLLDAAGRVREASDAFCRMLGYSREEAIGMDVAAWDAHFTPEELKRRLATLLRTREASTFETRHRRKDGTEFEVEVATYTLEVDGEPMVYCAARDISGRLRLEREQRASEEVLRGLYDLSPLGIALTDMEGRYLEFNEAFRQICGRGAAELRALDYWALTPKDYAAQEQAQLDALARTGRYGPYEKEYVRGDGSRVPVRLMGMLVTDADGRKRIWSIVEDISESRRTARELETYRGHLEELVAQRTAELEKAVAELESFSYSVSHDLKAPLRAIDGAVGILRADHGDQLPIVAHAYLERVSRNARQMGELIEALLEFAFLSRRELDRQPLRPEQLVRSVLRDHEEEIRARDVAVTVQALPPCRADAALLRQVFENLVSNALKYTADAASPAVRIGAMQEGGVTTYFVGDNGVGFDMAYADKLFGVFQRLHASTQFEGTGIGLALVRRIVERHGGRVWAEASPGQGATFYFTLEQAAGQA